MNLCMNNVEHQEVIRLPEMILQPNLIACDKLVEHQEARWDSNVGAPYKLASRGLGWNSPSAVRVRCSCPLQDCDISVTSN